MGQVGSRLYSGYYTESVRGAAILGSNPTAPLKAQTAECVPGAGCGARETTACPLESSVAAPLNAPSMKQLTQAPAGTLTSPAVTTATQLDGVHPVTVVEVGCEAEAWNEIGLAELGSNPSAALYTQIAMCIPGLGLGLSSTVAPPAESSVAAPAKDALSNAPSTKQLTQEPAGGSVEPAETDTRHSARLHAEVVVAVGTELETGTLKRSGFPVLGENPLAPLKAHTAT